MPRSDHDRETPDFHVLETIDELRALADPTRLEMLRLLTGEPMTGSAVARVLGIPANRAHYHVKRLVGARLVRPLGSTRRGEWKGERYFVAAARHFLVDPELACQDPDTNALLHRTIESAFFEWRRSQLAIDWAPLARKLVDETLRVEAGQHVLVVFRPGVLELCEAVLVEVEAAGAVAHPKPWSRHYAARALDRYDVEELDALSFVPATIDRDLDAVVLITTSLSDGSALSPEQQAKLPHLLGSLTRWHRSLRERGIRYAEVALPHRGEFARSTMSTEASIDVYWKCVNADPGWLHERGERLRARVGRSPDVHVVGPGGTDLRVTVDPSRTHVNDGVISDEDRRRGRCTEYIPTGGVSLLPEAGSGDGVVRAPYILSQGRRFDDVVIELRGGRIVHIDAGSGGDDLRSQLERAAGDPDLISGIGVGINVRCDDSTGKPTLDSHFEGVVTVSFGNNELVGGRVSSTLSLNVPIWGLSIRAGDQPLVTDGHLAPARR